jgi:hypothetical protein
MKLSEFKRILEENPKDGLSFILPENEEIPSHFHITEVARVDKVFVDCGGTVRNVMNCCLQAWVSDEDQEHRISPEKLSAILDKASDILRDNDLDVELEYEDCCVLSQYPVCNAVREDGTLKFQLKSKHTDCLAKEQCLPNGCGGSDGSCC